MTRSLPSLRTSTPKSIVALCLFAILLASLVVTSTVQARGMHELGPDRGGRTPTITPDFGGDDDQPTVTPQPSRRALASFTDSSPGFGSGGSYLNPDASLFTSPEPVVLKRLRAFWALLLRPVR